MLKLQRLCICYGRLYLLLPLQHAIRSGQHLKVSHYVYLIVHFKIIIFVLKLFHTVVLTWKTQISFSSDIVHNFYISLKSLEMIVPSENIVSDQIFLEDLAHG